MWLIVIFFVKSIKLGHYQKENFKLNIMYPYRNWAWHGRRTLLKVVLGHFGKKPLLQKPQKQRIVVIAPSPPGLLELP